MNLGSLQFVKAGECDSCDGTGHHINPDWEPAQTDQLPVFTNRLKDGKLSVTKQVSAEDPAMVDPTQEFHFRIKLIGPEVQPDAQMDYDLEQVTAFVPDPGADP